MGNFCRDCQYWLLVYESLGERKGTCDHPNVEGDVTIDPEPEEYVIHTDQWFGCVYFTPIHGNVVTKLPSHDKSK